MGQAELQDGPPLGGPQAESLTGGTAGRRPKTAHQILEDYGSTNTILGLDSTSEI